MLKAIRLMYQEHAASPRGRGLAGHFGRCRGSSSKSAENTDLQMEVLITNGRTIAAPSDGLRLRFMFC